MSIRRIGGLPDEPSDDEFERRTSAPIIVFAPAPRSGTNYLSDLLTLHPDLARPEYPGEDFFLQRIDLLDDYVDATRAEWGKWGVANPDAADELRQHIGLGLLNFMWSRVPDQRLVIKTPRSEHAHRFFDLFPHGLPLALVRDGRTSAESARRSFGWSIRRTAQMWAAGVRSIERLEAAADVLGAPFFRVHYEDIFPDPEPWLRAAFVHLGVDEGRYPFEDAAALPLRGSSTERGGTARVHWQPVERPPDFDPHDRWRDWSPEDHETFNRHAADELRLMGYEPIEV